MRRSRQVYGLEGTKAHYKQISSESYSMWLIIIGVLLALLIGFAVLGLEASH